MSRETHALAAIWAMISGVACSAGGANAAADAGGNLDATSVVDATGLGVGAGATDAGPSGDGASPGPHVVSACPGLDGGYSDPGAWENITPPQVSLDPDAGTGAGKNFGTNSFVIDPDDTATIYLGTSGQGIYKTTDCGATWAHVNTGRNGDVLDNGRQWAMLMDPTDPGVLFANSGYGPANGIFKSTNGGVDWDQILPPDVAKNFIFGGFVGGIAMDPTNHEHLILWPHFNCCDDAGTCNDNCVLESEDSGGSWTRLDVNGGTAQEGYGMMIVPDPSSPGNSKHWFLAETFGGLYETIDEGVTWHLVANAKGYAYPSIYVAPGGAYFVPAAFNVIESTNGGSAWSEIPGSPGADIITGTPTTMYAAHGGCTTVADQPFEPFSSAPASDPTKWTSIAGPSIRSGPGQIAYDEDHHLLYGSACLGGFWRGVVP
jgi:photosystem II stability/assembly factor-like uncharacterized protein